MSDLTKKKCTPCEGGVIPFDISEIPSNRANFSYKLLYLYTLKNFEKL